MNDNDLDGNNNDDLINGTKHQNSKMDDSDVFIANCAFNGFVAENNGDSILTLSNHSNSDGEFNLTIVNCTLNNITANNDGDGINAYSNTLVTIQNTNFSELTSLANSKNHHDGGTYIYQSVINLDNYAINNLIVDRCDAANYGGDFFIKSKLGYSITVNNLITANSSRKAGEIVSGSGCGTETTQNENEMQEELNEHYAFMLTDLVFAGKNFYDILLSSNENECDNINRTLTVKSM